MKKDHRPWTIDYRLAAALVVVLLVAGCREKVETGWQYQIKDVAMEWSGVTQPMQDWYAADALEQLNKEGRGNWELVAAVPRTNGVVRMVFRKPGRAPERNEELVREQLTKASEVEDAYWAKARVQRDAKLEQLRQRYERVKALP